MFDVSYKIFCERIIRQRLLVNKEVLRMGQLRKAFIELVKRHEDLDASNYRYLQCFFCIICHVQGQLYTKCV